MQDRRLHGRVGRALALLALLEELRDDPDMKAADIGLLAVMATHAGEDGRCWQSQSTLGDEVGQSRSWVNERLAGLHARGAIEKKRRSLGKGGETSCLYRLPAMDLSERPSRPADTPCRPAGTNRNGSLEKKDSLPAPVGRDGSEAASRDDGEWRPDAAELEWATVRRPDLAERIGEVAESFGLWQRAHGRRVADPAALWRKWVIGERTTGGGGRRNGDGRGEGGGARDGSERGGQAGGRLPGGRAEARRLANGASAADALARLALRRGRGAPGRHVPGAG